MKAKPVLLALLCVFAVLCFYVVIQLATRMSLGIPKSEHDALIEIYHSTNGKNWRYSGSTKFARVDFLQYKGWPIDDGEPCTWFGVECANGHVTKLNLDFRGIGWWDKDGYVPPEIGNLHHLKELSLACNSIRSLPPELGKLINLEKLELRYNRLREIPPEIGNLSNLIVLNLAWNPLSTLPPEIASLKALRSLVVSGVCLDDMPAEVRQLDALETW